MKTLHTQLHDQPASRRNDDLVESATSALRAFARALTEALSSSEYLCGDTYVFGKQKTNHFGSCPTCCSEPAFVLQSKCRNFLSVLHNGKASTRIPMNHHSFAGSPRQTAFWDSHWWAYTLECGALLRLPCSPVVPAETPTKTSIPDYFRQGRYEVGLEQSFYKVHSSHQEMTWQKPTGNRAWSFQQ